MFYLRNRAAWKKPRFQKKYGTLLEGYIFDMESKWQVVAMLVLFMLKRAFFVMVVHLLSDSLAF